MTQQQQDLAGQWAHQLTRLDDGRRAVVLAALQHSADAGWPASEEAVRLLVTYALGEITSSEYAAGILRSLGVTSASAAALAPGVPAPSRSSYVAGDVAALDPAPVPAPVLAEVPAPMPRVRREDAVHAYVTGLIPVGEFLRIARS